MQKQTDTLPLNIEELEKCYRKELPSEYRTFIREETYKKYNGYRPIYLPLYNDEENLPLFFNVKFRKNLKLINIFKTIFDDSENYQPYIPFASFPSGSTEGDEFLALDITKGDRCPVLMWSHGSGSFYPITDSIEEFIKGLIPPGKKSPVNKANENYKSAYKFYGKKEYEKGLKLLNEAVELYENVPYSTMREDRYIKKQMSYNYNLRGLLYKDLGHYQNAVADLEKALHYKEYKGALNLAELYAYHLKEYDKAIQTISNVFDNFIASIDISTFYLAKVYAFALLMSKRNSEAVNTYTYILKCHKHDKEKLSIVISELEEYVINSAASEAEEALQVVNEFKSNLPEEHNTDHTTAFKELEQSYKKAKEAYDLKRFREAYTILGDMGPFDKLTWKEIELTSGESLQTIGDAFNLKGKIEKALDDPENAIESCRKAIEFGCLFAYNNLVELYTYRLREYDKALQVIEEALEQPILGWVISLFFLIKFKGFCLLMTGKEAEARSSYKELCEKYRSRTAWTLEMIGELEKFVIKSSLPQAEAVKEVFEWQWFEARNKIEPMPEFRQYSKPAQPGKYKYYLWKNELGESVSLRKVVEDTYLLYKAIPCARFFPKPAILTFHYKDRKLEEALVDVLPVIDNLLYVSKKLKKVLEVSGAPIEFLPIQLRDCKTGKLIEEPYFIANIIGSLDCVDKEKSEIKYSSFNPGEVHRIKKLVLDEKNIPGDAQIFRISVSLNAILVREDLVRKFKNAGSKGIRFEEDLENPLTWF